jgi:hypothetical protein
MTSTYNGDNKIQAILDIKGHDILKRAYNLNGKMGNTNVLGVAKRRFTKTDGEN